MTTADFLNLLNPTNIYLSGMNFSLFIAATISPVILVIALWMRIAKTQVETVTGGGKWSLFLKDVGVWVFILGSYFAIANIVTELFNTLYSHFQSVGSYRKTMEHFTEALKLDGNSAEDSDFNGISLISGPMTFVAFVFYYFSFLVVTLVVKFLALAHAMVYSFSIAWGLVAIPLSISGSIKLLKGWAIMLGTVLLWPIIHYSAYAFFDPMFEEALSSFSLRDYQKTDRSQLYSIMTLVNALSFAITLSAPFIAQALVSNSGSIAGVVAPFATAAVAAAGAMAKQASNALKTGASAGGKGASRVGKEILSRLPGKGSGSGNNSPVPEKPGGGGSKGNSNSSSGTGANEPVSESGGSGAGNGGSSSGSSSSPKSGGDAGNKGASSASGGNAPANESAGSGAGNGGSSPGDSSPAKSEGGAANADKSKASNSPEGGARKTALKGAAIQAAMTGPVAEGMSTSDSSGAENKGSSGGDKKKKATQARRGAILNKSKGGK